MPSSRKKNRGKQRKEAAKAKQKCEEEAARKARQAPGWHELDNLTPQTAAFVRQMKEDGFRIEKGPDGGIVMHHPSVREGMAGNEIYDRESLNEEQRRSLADNYVHNYAQEVKEGKFEGAAIILRNLEDPALAPQLAAALAEAGVHKSLLRFLNESGQSIHTMQLRGSNEQECLVLPSAWEEILHLITIEEGCSDDVRLELAKGIEPFLMCVMDRKRELFGSNMIWHSCISSFFDLVRGIMLSCEAFLAMISYNGFLPFVAQASCWRLSRGDIVVEDKCASYELASGHVLRRMDGLDMISKVCYAAQRILFVVIDRHESHLQDATELRGEESLTNPLEQIACTPLMSNDPECTDSTIVGLIRMLKHDVEHHQLLLEWIIEPLLLTYGYVDGRVIAELCEYGRWDSSSKGARVVLSTMVSVLGLDSDYPDIPMLDSRHAAAVSGGLLELCIDTVLGMQDDDRYQDFVKHVSFIAEVIAEAFYLMAMHSETSKALRGRKEEILAALDVLRNSTAAQTDQMCTIIEDSVKASASSTCCNCFKEIDRKSLRFCVGCLVECYCSDSCQSESHASHRKSCDTMAAHSILARNKGASDTEVKRFERLRTNLMMNGCSFIKRNIEEIRDLAAKEEVDEEHGMNVLVHFGHCPPEFSVSRNETGDSAWNCMFISPVFYAFAEQMGLEAIFVKKIVPRKTLALGEESREV